MFDPETIEKLRMRLLVDQLEVVFASRGLKLSERFRRTLEDHTFGQRPPEEDLTKARNLALRSLTVGHLSELVCYESRGIGLQEPPKNPQAVQVMAINGRGRSVELFVARSNSLVCRIWENTVGTDEHQQLFPAGEIVGVTDYQMVIEREWIDRDALTLATRQWLAQFLPQLQDVPIRWLDEEARQIRELDALAQSVGYDSMQAMAKDAENDMEQD